MSSFLHRLGRRAARHAGKVVLTWVAVLLAVGGLAAVAGGELRDDLSIPGTEAQEGLDVLATRFPELTGTTAQAVYSVPQGERIVDHRPQVRDAVAALEDVDHVELVADPFDQRNRALAISEDGRHALVQVQLDVPLESVTPTVIHDVEKAAALDGTGRSTPTVDLGGQMFTTTSFPVSATEAIGLVVALLVLLVTLGSFVAAGIPLLTAVLGVAVTMGGIVLVAAATAVNSSTPSLAMMIGLAVGIDYALFLAARHRSQLAEGMDVEESVARSVATAGSAVIFAGATVVIALCGLVVARIPFLTVMGLAGAAAVAVAVAIAITLVPAVLALAGERLRPRARRTRKGRSALRRDGAARRRARAPRAPG